jgi:hypothetical protein
MRMRRQQGLSLIGVLIVGALLAFALLVGFRTVPALTEYAAIQRIVHNLVEEGKAGASVGELRRSFDRRAQIDDVSTINGADLEISSKGSQVLIEVAYERKVPVVSNVGLYIDFSVSSAATP